MSSCTPAPPLPPPPPPQAAKTQIEAAQEAPEKRSSSSVYRTLSELRKCVRIVEGCIAHTGWIIGLGKLRWGKGDGGGFRWRSVLYGYGYGVG